MRATHEHASKRSGSKKRRRSNVAHRQRGQARQSLQTVSETQAEPSQPPPAVANAPVTIENKDAADTLAATAAEHTFFAQACDFPVAELVDSDDAKPLLLRPEQLERRLWLRRQVTRLMAGLGTFSIIATAIQIASSV